MKQLAFLFACALFALNQAAMSQDDRTETVRFSAGATGTVIDASIKGYETVTYRLGAASGQTLSVTMETDNLSSYFNIYEPEKTPGADAAMYVGSINGNAYQGTLPSDGDYQIQVYMMRNAARRDETVKYSLKISITGSAAADNTSHDALVAGTEFNATGQVPCAKNAGQPMGSCDFGVIRQGGGSATVRVFWPDGGERNIYFENGQATSADSEGALVSENQSGLTILSIGANERFEIPDAVIFGG